MKAFLLLMLLCGTVPAWRGHYNHHRSSTTNTNATTNDHKKEIPDEQRLLLKLLHNYDINVRPVLISNDSVSVSLGFTLIQIVDLDEKNQVLTLYAWLEVIWKDPRLTWQPSDFNDLQVFRVPAQSVWLPDIVLYNNAEDHESSLENVKVMVTADGNVFWMPPTRLRSSCSMDISLFPFDWQRCQLKFGSWTHDKAQIDLIIKASEVDLLNYVINGEWSLHHHQIVRHEVVYPISDAVYPDVTVVLLMQRRILYYVLNILFPCLCLNVLNVLTFCLPTRAGEKMALSLSVLVSYSVFMLLVAQTLPPTSDVVPVIVVYLTVSMSLSSLSVITTVLAEKLHWCVSAQTALPAWARTLILGFFARIVSCKRPCSEKTGCITRRSAHAAVEVPMTSFSISSRYGSNESPEVMVGLLSDVRDRSLESSAQHRVSGTSCASALDDNQGDIEDIFPSGISFGEDEEMDACSVLSLPAQGDWNSNPSKICEDCSSVGFPQLLSSCSSQCHSWAERWQCECADHCAGEDLFFDHHKVDQMRTDDVIMADRSRAVYAEQMSDDDDDNDDDRTSEADLMSDVTRDSDIITEDGTCHTDVIKKEQRSDVEEVGEEWRRAAEVMNRLMFWVFLMLTLLTCLLLLVMLPLNALQQHLHGL